MITLKDIQEAYNEELDSKNNMLHSIISEDGRNFLDFKNRFDKSYEIDAKKNFLGSLLGAKAREKDAAKVQELLDENKLTHTYNAEGGKLVYTSPDLKLNNNEVKFISSATPACRDGYACIKNLGSLQNFLSLYNILSKEDNFNKYMESCTKYLYEDRKEIIDKNYNWIFKNWIKIKNIYIYTIYSYGSTDIYCDVEVDANKCKGIQDYLSKKSCVVLFVRVNVNTGKFYVGQDILNDRTELWTITKA